MDISLKEWRDEAEGLMECGRPRSGDLGCPAHGKAVCG